MSDQYAPPMRFVDARQRPKPATFLHSPASTSFVGRTHEIAQIQHHLDDPTCHLLTLVGPGGMGKTRLAQEVAASCLDIYANGVYFIPLQPLTSPELIVTTLAESLNIQFDSSAEPAEQLLGYLQNLSALLVLDNFEHLLGGVALLSQIIARAPSIKLLVTSRERLSLRDEWVFDVGGLTFPGDEHTQNIELYSAVQLFVQNAHRVRSDFSLAAESAAVIRLCALLEGMPLAVELASSWVRTLSCADILKQLEGGLAILESTYVDMPTRHRSMYAALEHSWTRLNEAEQAVFMRLSVFRGGFTFEAMAAVAAATPRIVAVLVDQSWLRRDRRDDSGRYDIHELLRQYGEEKLALFGTIDQVRDAHLDYYAEFMHQREKEIKFRGQLPALIEIDIDFENIRAAWSWATQRQSLRAIDKMIDALTSFCEMKGRFFQGEELFRFASAGFASLDSQEARFVYGRLRMRRISQITSGVIGNADEDYKVEIEAQIQRAQNLGDDAETAFCYLMLSLLTQDRLPRLELMERAFILYAARDDQFSIANMLSWIADSQLDKFFACALLSRAAELQREIGDKSGLGWSLYNLAVAIMFTERNSKRAALLSDESVAIHYECGNRTGLYRNFDQKSLRSLAAAEFEQSRLEAAEALQYAIDMNVVPWQQSMLARLALLQIVAEENYAVGKRMIAEALALTTAHSPRIPENFAEMALGSVIIAYIAGDLHSLRREYQQLISYVSQIWHAAVAYINLLTPAAILLLIAAGNLRAAVQLIARLSTLPDAPFIPIMTWFEKWKLMQHLQADLDRALGTEAYADAWERGKALDLQRDVKPLVSDYARLIAHKDEATPAALTPNQALPDPLTNRELEVLHLIAAGLSNHDIAKQLILSVGTVKWYVNAILSKMNVSSRTQAVHRARELKLLL
ncbi:MAG: AAA family ATPase [Anaerolineae bacterium]|nr:AAA family ATPase [Anaerolineae bacterium]